MMADAIDRLPLPLDTFLGREAEMAEVAALVEPGRLVTVTGPAGVGKTRLAVESARRLAAAFPDGAEFVALAGTTDAALVAQSVAAALSVGEQPGRHLAATLAERLRQSHLLMVLDNCEHVATGVADLLGGLLGASPGLAVMATSREPLGVEGETVWPLAPLEVPDSSDDANEVGASAAVRLFCERAASTASGFVLTAANAAAVAEVCRRLDGVPLAIELAAARVAVLSPAEIAARLGDPFGLLVGGGRGGPARHQSLQLALDWSHDLCSGPERAVLRRLSVFAGGAALDAAAEVCAGPELGKQQVCEILESLVDKSLVAADATGPHGRYRMLETVRHYARDRLDDAGESSAVQSHHARWFMVVAQSAEPYLIGADQAGWLRRLTLEHANLGAALDWALSNGDAQLALRLAAALALWWRVRGSFSEGRTYLEAALVLGLDADAGLRAKAAWGAALMAVMLGDRAGASALAGEALELYQGLGDTYGWARSLLVLANCDVFQDPLRSQPVLEQSVALARDAGDDWCLAHALGLGALSHRNQGEPIAARSLAEESVAVARGSQDAQGLRIGLILLGGIAFYVGDLDLAEAALVEGLAVTGDLGEIYGAAAALLGLGEVALARGDHERARRMLEEGRVKAQAAGTLELVVDAIVLQAQLARAVNDLAGGLRLYNEAFSIAAQAGSSSGVVLRGLGEMAFDLGDRHGAARLFNDALVTAQVRNDHQHEAAALFDLADLARAGGDHGRSVMMHHEALSLRRRIGDQLGLVDSLEALGGLAAHTGSRKAPYAARLLGAADALRQAHGYARSLRRDRYDADVATLRDAMGAAELEAAWAEGARFSAAQAVAYAVRGRRTPGRPRSGIAGLTRAEREVAALAAAGLSNTEIAARLRIDPEMVKRRLTGVFRKLGIRSRVDLVRAWLPGPTTPL